MADGEELKLLEIFAAISFDGATPDGIKCHPDGIHILYPVGNKICIRNMKTKKMNFLSGHTDLISSLGVSPSGDRVASGQFNRVGLKATVIIWDFETRSAIAAHEYHKICVESVAFSCDGSRTMSVGGRGCGQLVVWSNADDGRPSRPGLCCTTDVANPTAGDARTVAPFNRRNNAFITGGNGNLRVWSINPTTKTPSFYDVAMGKIKRHILSIAVNKDDDFAYCGTTSGDILKISLGSFSETDGCLISQPTLKGCYAKCGVKKKQTTRPEIVLYSSGVHCIIILDNGSLLVGAGNGTVEIIKKIEWKKPFPKTKLLMPISPDFSTVRIKKFNNAITSMQLICSNNSKDKDKHVIIGTKSCEMFIMNLSTFHVTLITACHTSAVNDIAFPFNKSEVFATASKGDIRIWCVKTCQELLRIQVSNLICSHVIFTKDGKSIISAWSDRCIRAFTPISGKLIYCIFDAHYSAITALAITSNGKKLVSGGAQGQVRVWDVSPQKQTLNAILKDHKGIVAAIKINNLNTEAVSAGCDGTCIIWDIVNMCRRHVFFAHTIFTCVCYEPTCCQILTGGHDKRVGYWEAGNGTLIRELEASKTSAILSIDVDYSGKFFITGGKDQILKLWKYNEGIFTHMGIGHSGGILSAKFSPDREYIVSCSTSGSIFIWKFPQEFSLEESNSMDSAKRFSSDITLNSLKTNENGDMPVALPLLKKSPSCSSQLSTRRGAQRRDENISTIDTARSTVITCNQDTTIKEDVKKK